MVYRERDAIARENEALSDFLADTFRKLSEIERRKLKKEKKLMRFHHKSDNQEE